MCSKCGKNRKEQRLVHKKLCQSCYRKKNREKSLLKNDKKCISCGEVSTTKWYSGPTCRKCYRINLYDNHKVNKTEWYINERICNNLRSRISKIVSGTVKCGSAIEDLGCSIEEFKNYIESQFKNGMSWDNYANDSWHIDHIKPLASFNLTDEKEIKKACHYSNLQPLWAEENLKKSNKYED